MRNERIDADEIVRIGEILVTTPTRTAFDMARHLPRDSAVRHLDALARATGITTADVLPLVDRYALALMDGGAQSPQELECDSSSSTTDCRLRERRSG